MPDDRLVGRGKIEDMFSRLPDDRRFQAKAFVMGVIGERTDIPASVDHELRKALMNYEMGGENLELSGEAKAKVDAAMAALPPEAPSPAPGPAGARPPAGATPGGGTLEDMTGSGGRAGGPPRARIERPVAAGTFIATPVELAGFYTEGGVSGGELSFVEYNNFTQALLKQHGMGEGKDRLSNACGDKIKAIIKDVKGGKPFAEAVGEHMPDMAGYAKPAEAPLAAGAPPGPKPAPAGADDASGDGDGDVPVWEFDEDTPGSMEEFMASLGGDDDAEAGGTPPGPKPAPGRKTPRLGTPAVGGEAPAAAGRGSTELAGVEDLESMVAGGAPPGPEPAPAAADDAAGAPPAAEPAIAYDLSDDTFNSLMNDAALVPGVSLLNERDRKNREKTCKYLFDAFGKTGRAGMTQPERDEFAQYALEIAGGARPNVAVQKYPNLKPVAVEAHIIKDEGVAGDEHVGRVEVITGMIGMDTLLARVVEEVQGEYSDVNGEWIKETAQARVLPHLTSALSGGRPDVYLPDTVGVVAKRISEMVANNEHLLPDASLGPTVDPAAMGGSAGGPSGPGGGAAAAPEPETRTPMKLEDAIEAARTSHFLRVDGTRFVEYLKKHEWFAGKALGWLKRKLSRKPKEKKPEEPERKKRLQYRDVVPVNREYAEEIMGRGDVPTSTSGSEVYAALEDVMAAFTKEVNEISKWQASDAHRQEQFQNNKKQLDYEVMTLVRMHVGLTAVKMPDSAGSDLSRLLNLMYSTAEITGKGYTGERRKLEAAATELEASLDYDTIILLFKYGIFLKRGGDISPKKEITAKIEAARKARGETEEPKKKKGKGDEKEGGEKPPSITYKLPAERIPEGCVATINDLFGALALKYLGADGNPETPVNMRSGFEFYSVIPSVVPVFNDDGTVAGLAFHIEENYQLYNQTLIDKNPDGDIAAVFPTPPGSERIMKIEDLVKELEADPRLDIKTESQKKFLSDFVVMYAHAVSEANLNFTDPTSKRDWIIAARSGIPSFAREIFRNTIVEAYLASIGAGEEAPAGEGAAEAAAAAGGGAPPPGEEEPKGRRLVRVNRNEMNEAGYNILSDPVGDAEGRSQIEDIVGNVLEAGELPAFIPVEGSDNVYEVDEGSRTQELEAVADICRGKYSGKKKTQKLRVPAAPVEVPDEFKGHIPMTDLGGLTNKHFGHYTGAIPVDEARKLAEDSEAVVVEGGKPHVDGEKFYRAACEVSRWVNKPKEIERIHNEMGEALKASEEANAALAGFLRDHKDPAVKQGLKMWEDQARKAYTAVDVNDENNLLNRENPIDKMRAEANRRYRTIVDDPEQRTVDIVIAYADRTQEEMKFLQREYMDGARQYDEMTEKIRGQKRETEELLDRWHGSQADVGKLSSNLKELTELVHSMLELDGEGKPRRRRAPVPAPAAHRRTGMGFFGKAAAAIFLVGAGYAAWRYGKPHVGPMVEAHLAAKDARAAETVEILTDIKTESQRVSGSYAAEGTAFQEAYDNAVNR